MAKTILIQDWAKGPNGFGYPQSQSRLNHLAKTGQIYPPAKKDGRRWVVDEDAVFIGCVGRPKISDNLPEDAKELVESVINGRTT
ncbi:excisionase [Citrobacter braakii]|uniref:excisionase n=1 Tax=Citrobacter braakii TaxID=57706 RepID=UPI002B252B12|nr:excisionase [Citrobacter braakii]MEB0968309.1 excisionase [Citrobacter braakii]